jgi:hypothetical protein
MKTTVVLIRFHLVKISIVFQLVSSKQQLAIETAAIEFFNNVVSCHAKNQLTFSRVLCDLIQSQKNAVPGIVMLFSCVNITP